MNVITEILIHQVIIMKKIWQLFILLFSTLSFVTIVFWWECDIYWDEINPRSELYENCRKDCKKECKWDPDPNCKNDCVKDQCQYYYDNRQYYVWEYDACIKVQATLTNVKQSCPNLMGVSHHNCQDVDITFCCWKNWWSPSCTWGNNTWANNTWANNTWWNNTWWNNTWANNTWANNTWWNNTWWNNTWGNNTWGNNTWGNNTWANNTWANNTWWNNTWWNNTGNQQWYANPNCAANLLTESSNTWCVNYNSGTSWYCNNWNWINLYMNNHPWTNSKQQSQLDALNQYMNFYNSGKNDSERIWTPSFNSPWWIWNLQKLLWVGADCKLWNNTMKNFFETDFCSKINSTRTTSSWSSCPEWKEVEWQCCKPSSCEKLLSWWSCDIYGSGYKPDGNCCVFDCSEWKQCDAWEKRSTWTCKCVCDPTQWCCGVQLNTVVPFIWDCIELSNETDASYSDGKTTINQLNAFPVLMKWLSKIVVTLIMIFSIIIVVIAWLMMTTSAVSERNYWEWMKKLRDVVIALILLWTSWLILRLINPTFFGG